MFGAETLLDQALASLRASLPARLDAISDDLGLVGEDRLPKPADDGGPISSDGVDYYIGTVVTPLRYPLVEIAVPDGSLTAFSLERLTANADLSLIVISTLRDARMTSDALYRSLLRYNRAVLGVLLDPGSFAEGGAISSVQFAYRTNPRERETEQVIGGAALAFSLATTDSRDLA